MDYPADKVIMFWALLQRQKEESNNMGLTKLAIRKNVDLMFLFRRLKAPLLLSCFLLPLCHFLCVVPPSEPSFSPS